MPENLIKDDSQRRQLVAIMFTDVMGFSSMMESDEVTAVGLVKAQREVVRKHIARYNGEERETIGDAFLVIFESVVNAVRCAIDIQRELWEFNQTRTHDNQVWIRIGIHLGDILIEEGSVFGEGVNLAARVEPLAEPGGICITRQVFDQVRHHIDISVSHLGVRELKNITDVPDIYRIRLSTTAPREPLTLREYLSELAHSPLKLTLLILAALIVTTGKAYWTFFAVHKSFARDAVSLYHEPVPKFEISRSEARSLNTCYEFMKKGLNVVNLRQVNKPPILSADAETTWELGPPKRKREFPVHEFIYENGDVKEEHVYDLFGVLQYKLFYEQGGKVATAHDRAGFIRPFENQIAGFGYEFDEDGREVKVENLNAFGTPKNDSTGVAAYHYLYNDDDMPVETSFHDVNGNPVENKDGVAIVIRTFNDDGLVLREEYLDRYRDPHQSLSGIAAIVYSYDGRGRLVLEKYLDKAGQDTADTTGACAKKFAYDGQGRLVETVTLSCSGLPRATRDGFAIKRYAYKGDQVVKESFYDENGVATTDSHGVSSIEIEYGADKRILEVFFMGPDGQPVVNDNQIHAIRYFYDSMGKPSRRISLDTNGAPTLAKSGFAEVRVQYNDRGDATEWAYFDSSGSPANTHDGYAVVRNEFDQFGNLISKAFFDRSNEPVMGRGEACHKILTKYDEKGNLDESRCLDRDGKLTAGMKHCAISRYDYDIYGKLTRFECYVDEGKFIDDPNLPSVLTIKYDKRGYMSEVEAFDAAGNPAERYQGAAVWKRVSDDYGNQIEISTYDRNGNLINNPKYNAAVFKREFDQGGREIKAQMFDTEGKPTAGIWGFAELRYSYDNLGRKVSELYFGVDGEPVNNWQDVHEYRTVYDDKGRILEIQNIGVDGSPTRSSDGVSFIRYTYDKWGWVSSVAYFDENHNPLTNRKIGAAMQRYNVDDRGNILEIKRFDENNNLCRQSDCVAVTKQEFDSKGRLSKQLFFDADGKPMLDDFGAAGYVNSYDVAGRVSEEHVIGVDGKDAKDEDGVHGYSLHYQPETGKLWFMTFADEGDKEGLSKLSAEMRIFIYDPFYQERKKARVDVKAGGQIVSIVCLDEAGNNTEDKTCVTPAVVKAEFNKIKAAVK